MIKVQGVDPAVIGRRLRHHAEKRRPLINEIVYGLLFESAFARDDQPHVLLNSRGGPGSYGLWLADGRQMHFRFRVDRVEILDAYFNGKVIATLATPAQARSFWRRVS